MGMGRALLVFSFLLFSVIATGASSDPLVVMPGPKDDLYAVLKYSWENKEREARACNPDTGFKVDLHSEQDVAGYKAGQVFGAQVCGVLGYDYGEIQALYSSIKGVLPALRGVATFREIKVLREVENGFWGHFEIIVPLMENYMVRGWIIFSPGEDYSVLHWYQEDSGSRMLNNRGFMIIAPDGPHRTKVFLSGYHILKESHRLRFPFSSFAPGFTRDHYGNYFRAFEGHLKSMAGGSK